MPTVSVVIPTYGHRDYVLQTLESVFAQTYTDLEVIVVNDGSPDDTHEVLRPLVEARRIRYVDQPNAGQAAARNRGLAEARGEFVAFLDDDDLWPVDKLQWQVEALRANPEAVLVYGRFDAFTPDGGRRTYDDPLPGGLVWERLFKGNVMMSPGQALIRNKPLWVMGGFDTSVWGSDDLDLWFRLGRQHPFVFVDRVALHYRMHDANASRDVTRMVRNTLKVFNRQLDLADDATRPALRREAGLWTYQYAGDKLTAEFRHDLRHLKLRRVARSLPAVVGLGRSVWSDRAGRQRFLNDLLPRELLRKRREPSAVATAPAAPS